MGVQDRGVQTGRCSWHGSRQPAVSRDSDGCAEQQAGEERETAGDSEKQQQQQRQGGATGTETTGGAGERRPRGKREKNETAARRVRARGAETAPVTVNADEMYERDT